MKTNQNFLIVIPARMASTRFPGKVLADLGGRPVVEWCRQAALQAKIGPVVVATEDKNVADALRPLGADVVMTSSRCQSGTDRVWEAARKRLRPSIRYVINLQGDEPLIPAPAIRKVAELIESRKDSEIATAVVPAGEEDGGNPNSVKAVLGKDGRCLYFSRAAIPFSRRQNGTGRLNPDSNAARGKIALARAIYFKHIGIYAFRRDALARFIRLPPSPLEQRESLEQLRALEAGMKIVAAIVRSPAIAIDTLDDLDRARRAIAKESELTTTGALNHG